MAIMKFYVCILVFIAVASGAEALQCYECGPCNDPFDSINVTTILECPGSCVKVTGGSVVGRSCSPVSGGDGCEMMGKEKVCSCTSNLCNNAPRHGISIICLSSITIATLLWKV